MILIVYSFIKCGLAMRFFQVARVFIVGFPTQQHNKIPAFLYTSQAVSQNPKQREVKVFDLWGTSWNLVAPVQSRLNFIYADVLDK